MTDDPQRRATEELLAGFDRPGRSPRAPGVRLDFSAPASAETVLVTRRRSGALWPWVLAAFVASTGLGIIVLMWATRQKPPEPTGFEHENTLPSPAPPAMASEEVAFVTVPSLPLAPSSAAPPEPPRAPTSTSSHVPTPVPKRREHRDDFVPTL